MSGGESEAAGSRVQNRIQGCTHFAWFRHIATNVDVIGVHNSHFQDQNFLIIYTGTE